MNDDLKSVTHYTANENGNEEVVLEYDRTLWNWICRKPAHVERWEKQPSGDDRWINKSTGETALSWKRYEIWDALMWVRTQGKYFKSNGTTNTF